ncbi:divalent-cation tolerance protein CutA [Alcaligenes endophyticus]|uniref:Divalent-cation tolerance protein CutA n=2 Tax=Alcaligenes endophyticus TaxID=1929088 RepID=A0ABT8EEP1_9BURK|nr:divalent-cation tolerance protein CutA [Alcaligenes endophyticus]MCX5592317.1 divalent-cation tolerance protein CutA [Alcaligenes endophyticus]MDN4119760.1 divalent-cation tolerance protein CutA [Alcaligenes endophyticus]
MTTVPDMMLAKRIAHYIVEEGLAACANLGQVGLSMYMWQGELQGSEEVSLTFKTTVARVPELAERLRSLHPYELPELLCVPVLGGYASYIDWVRTSTAAS